MGSIVTYSVKADKKPRYAVMYRDPSHKQIMKRGFARKRDEEPGPIFPRVTPHDLRHTAASLAISAGANVKAVQRMLGHASAAMTLDVYGDLFDDDLDSVATALDQARTRSSVSTVLSQAESENEETPENR